MRDDISPVLGVVLETENQNEQKKKETK